MKKIKRHAPQKIVVIAGAESITCNNINEALAKIHGLLSEGRMIIEIENVSRKIEITNLAIESTDVKEEIRKNILGI